MKELPENTHNVSDKSLKIVTKKGKERYVFFFGILICVFLAVLLYLLNEETKSIRAHMEGAREVVLSPIDGQVTELPLFRGQSIEKGTAVLRFDSTSIREQHAQIRDYLIFFQQNRHNTGTLKQKFKPIFSHIFDDLALSHKELLAKEKHAQQILKTASLAHSRLKLQMRDPKQFGDDGLPNPDLVAKEAAAAKEVLEFSKNLEKASLERAGLEGRINKVTKDLNQPHGMLYRYLEEENRRVQNLVRNEYLYAPNKARFDRYFVKVGDKVEKDMPLYEILPENSGQWWVNAVFKSGDISDMKEMDICTVVTDDGLEFPARVISIERVGAIKEEDAESKPSSEMDNVVKNFFETLLAGEAHVRLYVQDAPEELNKYNKGSRNPNIPDVPIYVTVIR